MAVLLLYAVFYTDCVLRFLCLYPLSVVCEGIWCNDQGLAIQAHARQGSTVVSRHHIHGLHGSCSKETVCYHVVFVVVWFARDYDMLLPVTENESCILSCRVSISCFAFRVIFVLCSMF